MPPPAVERAWEAIALTMVALRDGDEHAAFSSAGLDASVTALRFRRGQGNEVTLGGHFLGRAIKMPPDDDVLHAEAEPRHRGQLHEELVDLGPRPRPRRSSGPSPGRSRRPSSAA